MSQRTSGIMQASTQPSVNELDIDKEPNHASIVPFNISKAMTL